MMLIHTALLELGTSTPMAETKELLLGVQVEKQLVTTTSLAMFSLQERSTAL